MKYLASVFFLQLTLVNIVYSKPQTINVDDKITFKENAENIDMESGKFYQGDIKLLPEQIEFLKKPRVEEGTGIASRSGWLLESFRWPKNDLGQAVVPYTITESDYCEMNFFPHSGTLFKFIEIFAVPYHRQMIKAAFSDIEEKTCVRFVIRTNEEDYIHIHSDDGCYSYLGKIGGEVRTKITT